MGHEAIKLELIEWLAKLDNTSTLEYLKVIKDADSTKGDWWTDLSDAEKAGIQRGLKDADEGRLTSHEDVKSKYGL